MSEYPVLSYAPIIESLVDLKVAPSDGITVDQLASMHAAIAAEYPDTKPKLHFEFKFQPGGSEPVFEQSGREIGYMFHAADGLSVVQSRLDGFTYSRLRPYSHWQDFIANTRRLWEVYKSASSPNGVIRVGLRTINRIEIPLPVGDFKEYILTIPEVAPNVPAGLSELWMRLVIPQPDMLSTAIITQTMPLLSPGTAAAVIFFDIDVFQAFEPAVEDDKVWNVLESLRNARNEIFFNSLTEKAKDMYK